MLARQPLGAVQSLSIFGAERLADLLCLLLLSLPGLWWLLALQTPRPWLPALAVTAGLGALLGIVLFFKYSAAWLARFHWIQQAWQCLSTRPLTWLALTLAAWAAQGLAMWLVCADSGVDIGIPLATGFYALAMVGGALSLLPAGLGGMEALLTGLLVTHGAVLGVAVAVTVSVRLLTLWLAVAIGALALLYSAAIHKDIRFS